MKSLSLNQPHFIVMVGQTGSGKTFFAEKFSETFNAPYVNFADIHQLADEDEELTQKILDMLLQQLFKTKHAIIFEGPTATRADRTQLANIAKAADYQTLFVWVQTDPISAKNRAIKAGHDEDDLDDRARSFDTLHASEKSVVISGKHTFGTQLKAVLKKITVPRIETPTEAPTRPVAPSRTLDVRRMR